ELRILQVAQARWLGAGRGEPVVEPGRGTVAEVGRDRRVDRGQDLPGHEDDADRNQRAGQRVAGSHRADERAQGDGARGRQQAARDKNEPPRAREPKVGPVQHGEELPLLAVAQSTGHAAVTPGVVIALVRRFAVYRGRVTDTAQAQPGLSSATLVMVPST